MGFCFSCCRRRRHKQDKQIDVERQPLLRSDTNALKHPETRTPYEKVTDALAALHAGKLPTQHQLDAALRTLLRSGMLDVDSGEDALDETARKVIEDAREVVEVVMQVGLEKNDDNRVQDLLYQFRKLSSRTIPLDIKSSAEVQVNAEMMDKIQTAASAIPSQEELALDTLALVSSLRTLASLLLTSSAFRLIIGDLLLTARELVADTAAQVRKVAETVEHVSEAVEINVRPDAGTQPVATDLRPDSPSSSKPAEEETRSSKEIILERIEDIFRRAQASPHYNSALRTLLYIFRKYAERVSLASTAISESTQPVSGESSVRFVAPIIVPDPRFGRALEDLRVLLERFASGKSLDPLLQSLLKTVHDSSVVQASGENSDVHVFFKDVGAWLDRALSNPSFASSRAGQKAASQLYDQGSSLLSQNTQLSENINNLLDEANAFLGAVRSDRSTNKLFRAIDNLHSDILKLLGQTAEVGRRAATHWRTTLLRAVLGWMLPRILRAIRVLPMPRFEYISSSGDGTRIEAAVDALLLSAEEALVPDVLSVQEFAEVRVEVDENVGAAGLTNPNARILSARKNARQSDLERALQAHISQNDSDGAGSNVGAGSSRGKKTKVTTTSRVRIHVEGLRVAAHNVGYYASYARNSWLRYTDEGLLSVEIGRGRHRRSEGLLLDAELEMNSDHDCRTSAGLESGEAKLFRVSDVRTAIPGLALHVAHSRHWILNSLFAPLAGPIGRTIGPRILNAQIQTALESLEKLLREVKAGADEKAENRAREQRRDEAETSASDWWDALLEKFSSGEQNERDSGSEDEDEQEEQEVYTETHTEANLTGITRTTIEQAAPEPQDEEVPPTTENTLGVGLGAQLLPGKGEPTALGIERESPQEAAHEVAAAGREAIDDVQGKVHDVQEGMHDIGRKGIEEAVRVRRMAEDVEERIERQERWERRRGGWRSHAFDL